MYVDDGLVFSPDQKETDDVIKQLQSQFKLRTLEGSIYRWVEIQKEEEGISLHQTKYTKKILDTFNMTDVKPTENPTNVFVENEESLEPEVPYRSAVGSLAYLADTTRPDIAFAICAPAERAHREGNSHDNWGRKIDAKRSKYGSRSIC